MADILEDPHQGGFETVYGVRTFYSEKYVLQPPFAANQTRVLMLGGRQCRYNKDLVFFALGDMDASDSPPKQGVVVLDGSGISADGYVLPRHSSSSVVTCQFSHFFIVTL